MPIQVRRCALVDIASLRELYRDEMRCQILHDSIHTRPGWSVEYALSLDDAPVGYGSVAVAGPWQSTPSLYEFFVDPAHRLRTFDLFAALCVHANISRIETQTNDPFLSVMLHTFAHNVCAEAILFEDHVQTTHAPAGAVVRARASEHMEQLQALDLDENAGWVVTLDGKLAGAGGVLYHYNRPYGDVYMKIAEPFRGKGLGAFLTQELKRACRASGMVPAARCNVGNLPSRKTLQKAGFVPCGTLISGELD